MSNKQFLHLADCCRKSYENFEKPQTPSGIFLPSFFAKQPGRRGKPPSHEHPELSGKIEIGKLLISNKTKRLLATGSPNWILAKQEQEKAVDYFWPDREWEKIGLRNIAGLDPELAKIVSETLSDLQDYAMDCLLRFYDPQTASALLHGYSAKGSHSEPFAAFFLNTLKSAQLLYSANRRNRSDQKNRSDHNDAWNKTERFLLESGPSGYQWYEEKSAVLIQQHLNRAISNLLSSAHLFETGLSEKENEESSIFKKTYDFVERTIVQAQKEWPWNLEKFSMLKENKALVASILGLLFLKKIMKISDIETTLTEEKWLMNKKHCLPYYYFAIGMQDCLPGTERRKEKRQFKKIFDTASALLNTSWAGPEGIHDSMYIELATKISKISGIDANELLLNIKAAVAEGAKNISALEKMLLEESASIA